MSYEVVGISGILIFIFLCFLRVPLAIAMSVVGVAGYATLAGIKKTIYLISLTPDSLLTYGFSSFPIFVFMGYVVVKSGVANELMAATSILFSGNRASLPMATIVGCAGFSSISGSSLATASTFSQICIPEMMKSGYSPRIAAGSVAAGGTLGILIPPSGVMIIYALITEGSVPRLFAAGIIPGLILTAFFLVAIQACLFLRPEWFPKKSSDLTERYKLSDAFGIWKVAVLFSIAVGGIYGGYFSPTEAASVAAFVALVIGVITKRLSWKEFKICIDETVIFSASIFFILIGAWIFGYFISISQLPQSLASAISGSGLSHISIILLIMLFYIIAGCFLDSLSTLVVTVPLFLPLVMQLGYDATWFGVLMVIMVEIGLITPPVGLNLFVIRGQFPNIQTRDIVIGTLPFLLTLLLLAGLLIAYPSVALWLPNQIYK